MPYIGHSPTQAGSYIEVDDFGSSFNGSNVAFTLQVGGVNITPNQQNLLVMIDGVLQQPSNAFSVSGSTITFTEAPASGADLYCLLMGQSASVGQGTIGADELKVSGDGSDGQVLKSDGDGTFTWLSQTDIAAGTLANARTINGVSFDGSANITITSAAGTLTGNTLASGITSSSLTSVGTLSSLTVSGVTTKLSNANAQLWVGEGDGNSDIYMNKGSTNKEVRFSKNSTGNLDILTNGGVIHLNSNGTCGIGTGTPSENLTVLSTASSDHTRVHIEKTTNAGTAGVSMKSKDSGSWTMYVQDANSGSLYFHDGSENVLTLGTDNSATFVGTITSSADMGGGRDTGMNLRSTNSSGYGFAVNFQANDGTDDDRIVARLYSEPNNNTTSDFRIATRSGGTLANRLTITGNDATFSGQVNFGTTDSYIKQSNFGYSASYHVLQLGEASSTRAISIGADLTSNASGGFTGNEIIIPNARGILAPNGADNAYLGVLGVTSSNTIEIGRGNHSIVTAGNGAISIDTSTNHVSIAGGQSTYSTLGVHTGGTNSYSETSGHHTNSAITIDFPNADQSFGAIRWRSHGNMEQFFGVVQQGSSAQGDWVWQGFDGSAYAERMRLSEEGLLSIKWGIDSYGLHLNGLPSSSTKGILLACGPSSGTVDAALFRDGNSHNCGAIYLDATNNTANFSTSSDYRLKENEEIIPDGIERIKKLKPYKFNFKSNADKTKVDGFFAHELAEHIPEAVNGEKDEMEDGEIKPQSVDYGKVTPLLVKAVQELIEKVEVLENA